MPPLPMVQHVGKRRLSENHLASSEGPPSDRTAASARAVLDVECSLAALLHAVRSAVKPARVGAQPASSVRTL